MKEKRFLAIDLGASNGRVILGRLSDGKLSLEEIHRFDHAYRMAEGRRRWDWGRIVSQVREGLAKAVEMCGTGGICSISCDSWAQDFGLLDAEGTLLEEPVSYRDAWISGMPFSFSDIISPDELVRRVGVMATGITTLCQLRAMAVNAPGVFSRAATLLYIADLIHHDLSGERATDWTFATASQLRNLKTGTWDRQLLSMLSIPSRFLPAVKDSPSLLGTIRKDRAPHPALAGVPVVISAGHDTTAASVCLPADREEKTLLVSSGTWTMIGCRTDRPLITEKPTEHGCGVLGIPRGRWSIWNGVMGLWILQECRRAWAGQGFRMSHDEIEQAAVEAGDSQSLIDPDEPRFIGPENMLAEIEGFCRETGQRVPSTIGEVARTVLASLALRCREAKETLEKVTGRTFSAVRMVGGGSRDRLLCSLTADALGIPVVSGPAEATTAGNVLLQAELAGEAGSEKETADVIEKSFPVRRHEPTGLLSDQSFRRFRDLRNRKNRGPE